MEDKTTTIDKKTETSTEVVRYDYSVHVPTENGIVVISVNASSLQEAQELAAKQIKKGDK